MSLEKARVQLLNPDTDTVIAEVDILTSASAVSYINKNKMSEDFRGLKTGTSFTEEDEVSLQDVLDDLLFPYTTPVFEYLTDNSGAQFTEDKTIYVERFTNVRPFYITSKIRAGRLPSLTITLKRYNLQNGTVATTETVVRLDPGSTYLYREKVDIINFDTNLQITISDGKTTINSPMLSFEFINPVFVGYCELDQITSDDGIIIDDYNASSYFNTLIRTKSLYLEKRLCPAQDIPGIILSNPLYQSRSLYPCIIYPNTWNKLASITDVNGNNITGSFLYNASVPITIDGTVSSNIQYTVYACKRSYLVHLAAAGGITYNFTGISEVSDNRSEGTPTLTGFDVLCSLPLDLRTRVETYGQLSEMMYPYDGLVTFVRDEKTFFEYHEGEGWTPTNQKVYLTMTGKEPTLDVGSWNDITIDIKSGIFWQKHQNIRWEEKGRFIAGSGFIDKWGAGTYGAGSVVYHGSKFWKATSDTTSEPGTDSTWEETTVGGGIPGPVGPAGDAGTIAIVDVVTGEPNTPATVENLGDAQNARLRITIPRGEKGDPGVYNGVIVPKPSKANQVLVSFANGEVDWIDRSEL